MNCYRCNLQLLDEENAALATCLLLCDRCMNYYRDCETELSVMKFSLLNAFARLIIQDKSLPPEFAEWKWEEQIKFINSRNATAHFEIGGEIRHQLKRAELEIMRLKKLLDQSQKSE